MTPQGTFYTTARTQPQPFLTALRGKGREDQGDQGNETESQPSWIILDCMINALGHVQD